VDIVQKDDLKNNIIVIINTFYNNEIILSINVYDK